MKKGLDKAQVKRIYDRSSAYYDLFHKLGTYNLDNRGRKYLVDRIVKDGDLILDAGGGTGTTTMLALKKAGRNTKAVILDFSENMLQQARQKAIANHLENQVSLVVADLYDIPFPDNHFDVVISTYSTCPLENPANAVREMLRVLKVDGLLGIAHSCDPNNKPAQIVSSWVESVIWKFPGLSLGCRKFDLSNDLTTMNIDVIEDKIIGFVPWYFRLLILQKKER